MLFLPVMMFAYTGNSKSSQAKSMIVVAASFADLLAATKDLVIDEYNVTILEVIDLDGGIYILIETVVLHYIRLRGQSSL